MGILEGKVAIVTGAGRGLGRAISQRFAEEGAKVALLSRTVSHLDEAVELITSKGGKAIGIPCDVLQKDAIADSVRQVVDAYKGIDILINNAHDTALASQTGTVLDTPVEQAQHQFNSGPMQTMVAMQNCFPYLKKSQGRVINMASYVGVVGFKNFLPYAMAKESIRTLTRVAAREWGEYGITVNSICPAAETDTGKEVMASGLVDTLPVPPIARFGSPYDDIAPVAVFLASDQASFITGYNYMVDGGISIDAAR